MFARLHHSGRFLSRANAPIQARAARRACSSALGSYGGRISRFTLDTADVARASAFYADALGLKLSPQSGAAQAVAGDGLGLSCDVVLLRGARSAAAAGAAGALDGLCDGGDADEDPLIHPFLTIGVSNLKTSARHARRQYGAAVRAPSASAPASALFADPDGRALRALHLFRRTPVLSVTLRVAGAEPAALAYERVLRLRRVSDPEELREAHVLSAARSVVLAYAPAHRSTVIVLEGAAAGASASGAISAAAAPGAAQAHAALVAAARAREAPVLTLELPDVPDVHARAASEPGWATSDLAADGSSFTAVDADGNLLHVVKATA